MTAGFARATSTYYSGEETVQLELDGRVVATVRPVQEGHLVECLEDLEAWARERTCVRLQEAGLYDAVAALRYPKATEEELAIVRQIGNVTSAVVEFAANHVQVPIRLRSGDPRVVVEQIAAGKNDGRLIALRDLLRRVRMDHSPGPR